MTQHDTLTKQIRQLLTDLYPDDMTLDELLAVRDALQAAHARLHPVDSGVIYLNAARNRNARVNV
jgi:hypothetical protein